MDIVLGSRNDHKLKEMSELLPGVSLATLPDEIPTPEENGDSFVANAAIKSIAYAKATGSYVLADDSGICVDALNGAPGIYSARFAGEDASDDDNNQKLKKDLSGNNDRGAHYVCVLSLATPEDTVGHAHIALEGRRACRQGNQTSWPGSGARIVHT